MHQQNQPLLQALADCLAACEHCATACLQEQDVKMMVRCIQLDRDCADICALTARFVARGSEHAQHLLRECAEICRACGIECAKHHHMEHCRMCAEACKRCEEACMQIVGSAGGQ
ncbi:four-helix bundle copper-binding protein [Hymenobacter coalescens]